LSVDHSANISGDNPLSRLNYFYSSVFGENIKMNDFDSRLKVQKLIYILKSANINFPYDFTWYIYGPYSSELTRDGYAFAGSINNIMTTDYNPSLEERRVVGQIGRASVILDDPDRAELVASFLYLTDRYESQDLAEEQLMIRKPRFSKVHIQQVMREWFERIQS
jgi:uncharacterized protein YwgA